MSEELKNIRRMAERGLKCAQTNPVDTPYIDIFQHIIDTCYRVEIELNPKPEVEYKSYLKITLPE